MIYTFYSFKGGVGRSMALANAAYLLKDAGLNVLMVDWDLEAPGLERFFDGPDRVLEHPGLIDLLQAYKRALSQPRGANPAGITPAVQFPPVDAYTVDLAPRERGTSGLKIMPAGRRDGEWFTRYAEMVRGFDWQDFYQNWEGELFFDWLRKEMLKLAEVVLIDSRTGVTEMGGVCTYQLADQVVMFAAPNQQNINGTVQMAQNFRDPDLKPLRGGRPLEVLFVPTRVEDRAESQLLTEFKNDFRARLSTFFPEPWKGDGDTFWQLKVPHVPYYAFNEAVAVRARSAAGSEPLVHAYTGLVREMALLAPPETAIRDRVVRRAGEGYDAFLVYNREDRDAVERLAVRLRDEASLRVFLDVWEIRPGELWQAAIEHAWRKSAAVVVFIGQRPLDADISAMLVGPEADDRVLIPVVVPGGQPDVMPLILRIRQSVTFQDLTTDRAAFRSLCDAITATSRTLAPAPSPSEDSAVSQIQEAWSRADAYAQRIHVARRREVAVRVPVGLAGLVVALLLTFRVLDWPSLVPSQRVFPFDRVVGACGVAVSLLAALLTVLRPFRTEELRAGHAALIREIFCCRARVGAYRADARQGGSRGQTLMRNVSAIDERLRRLSLDEAPRPVEGAAVAAERVSDLSPEEYIGQRLRDTVRHYHRRELRAFSVALVSRVIVMITGLASAALAVGGQWALGAVVLLCGVIVFGTIDTARWTIGAALEARAAGDLDGLLFWWSALPADHQNRDAFERLVTSAEGVILAASGGSTFTLPGAAGSDAAVASRTSVPG